MARQVFSFDPPDRFVVGTVGMPGERTFFLQAKADNRVISVALEKVQVQVLAERLDALLDEVRRRGGGVPPVPPAELEDVAPLDQPILEEFRVGTLSLAWDREDGRIVIEALAMTDVEGQDAPEAGPAEAAEEAADAIEPDLLRVRITAGEALAFAARALRVVSAGRPPCPLCGLPLDPEGHVCPRMNGQRH